MRVITVLAMNVENNLLCLEFGGCLYDSKDCSGNCFIV